MADREMTYTFGRLVAAWQRAFAAVFALAVAAAPVLALAQAGGDGGGTGGGGTGSAQPGSTPPGGPPAGSDGGGGSGFAWIVVFLAVAVAFWLFTRRRAQAHRP